MFSCKGDIQVDMQEVTPITDDELRFSSVVSEENGLITISSIQDAISLEESFMGKSAINYFEMASNIPNFESAEQAYLNLDKSFLNDDLSVIDEAKSYARSVRSGEDVYIQRVIDEPILSALANKNGWLAVGEKVYLITYEKAYIVSFYDYLAIKEGLPLEDAKSLEIKDIIRNGGENDLVKATTIESCEDFYGTRRRVILEVRQGSSIFSSNINNSLRIRHLRRNRWPKVWLSERADQLSIIWDLVYINVTQTPPLPTEGAISLSNIQNYAVPMPSGNFTALNENIFLNGSAIDGGGVGSCDIDDN
jgi:hypothetical protein